MSLTRVFRYTCVSKGTHLYKVSVMYKVLVTSTNEVKVLENSLCSLLLYSLSSTSEVRGRTPLKKANVFQTELLHLSGKSFLRTK